jgi:PAS domain S-box-containing protein
MRLGGVTPPATAGPDHPGTAGDDAREQPLSSRAARSGVHRWRALAPYAVAILASAAATLATGVLWPKNQYILFAFYYLGVLVSAIYGDARAAALAVILSLVSANYFFLAPGHGVRPDALAALFLFPVISTVLVFLITQVRTRERTLLDSEARMADAQRIAKLGSWDWHIESGRMNWSDQLFEVLGVAQDAVPSYDAFIERVHPDDRARVAEELRVGLAEKAEIVSDYRLLLPDGTVKMIHGRGAVERDQEGRALRLAGTTLDITERARAQEQLRVSEERFRSLLEVTAAVFWRTDAAGRITEATPSWGDFTGMSREEMTQADGWFSAVHPDDRTRAATVWRTAAENGTPYYNEYRLRRNDAVWRDMIARGVPLRNSDGTVREWIGTCVDVTDLKAAQEAVRFQAQVLDATGESIIATDAAGKVIYMNRFAGTQFGWTPHEAMGVNIMDVTVPKHSRQQAEEVMDAVRAGRSWTGDFTAQRRDGRTFPIRASNTPLFNDAGELAAIIGVARDMSEYREAERALRESEARYRAMFSHAAVGVCEISFAGKFERVNPRACELFGYSADELMKLKFSDITHPDDLARTIELVTELQQQQREFFAIDKRYIRKDRREICAASTVSLLRDAEGLPQGLIAVVEDISARKEAEEKLRFQAHMLDHIGEAVIAVSPKGKVIYLNRYAEALYGWPQAEVIGRPVSTLALVKDVSEYLDGVIAILHEGARARGEYSMQRRDGSAFDAIVSHTALFGGHGELEAIIAISSDFTERKRVMQELERSESRLRALTARLESLREEERTRIARAIHDELGQLLTGLKMDLRWVEGWLEKSDDVRLRPFLDRIVGGSELTDAIIKAVQGIAAELRPGVLDTLGLKSALEFEARRFYERTGTKCVVKAPSRIPPLSAEVTTALFRIFQECLTNIARHSGATAVEVVLELVENDVHLCVADNGRGMREIERVAVDSLGLLGISERAKLLRGDVMFSSTEGGGTTIDVRVPYVVDNGSSSNGHGTHPLGIT